MVSASDGGADLNMVPLDTGRGGYITFWCPLRSLSKKDGDSMLEFASGSHTDMALGHWFPASGVGQKQLLAIIKDRYSPFDGAEELRLGDCTGDPHTHSARALRSSAH
jgi:hypothetical protein|eukprot:SAG25_NODE_209_length_11844_cov_3.436782_12_plen_108_part_00